MFEIVKCSKCNIALTTWKQKQLESEEQQNTLTNRIYKHVMQHYITRINVKDSLRESKSRSFLKTIGKRTNCSRTKNVYSFCFNGQRFYLFKNIRSNWDTRSINDIILALSVIKIK